MNDEIFNAQNAAEAGMMQSAQQNAAGGDSLLGGTEPAQPEGAMAQNAEIRSEALDLATLAIPDGFRYDQERASEFAGIARELKLSQAQAQKLVDLHAKGVFGASDFEEKVMAQREQWKNETMNHPEFGGARFTENLGHAKRFVEMFGGDELRQALDYSGVGNHPALFAAFAKAGRILAEDRLVSGGVGGMPRGTGTFADMAQTLYPEMRKM